MIDSVLNGEGYPQWSAMSPAEGNFYTPNVTHYDYDSSKSVGFLLAAGFTYNRDQRAWKDQAGHIVEFSFITNGGNTAREKIAGVICKNLEKIGLKVNFQMLEFDSLIKKIQTPPYNWDAALIGLCGGPEPQFGENFWRSSENSNLWFPGRKSPADPWEAAIDGIFDSTGRIFDDNRRRELFCQWQRIVADELPVIYTILPERIECVSGKIGNVNPSLYGGILHSVERLYIKK
jgi:peptide/nickel transport system substrate-binding protein